MEHSKYDERAAARLGITAEQVAYHRSAGRHVCVDGRWYNDVCLVVDPICTAVARHAIHHKTARPPVAGELIRVVAFGGALDGLDRVNATYHLRVTEVTVRPHLNWDGIEGVIEEPDRPRLHGKERTLLARPHHYDIVS